MEYTQWRLLNLGSWPDVRPMTPARRQRLIVVVGVVTLGIIAALGLRWDHRQNRISHNFRTVEPGKIYAGGFQYRGPLQKLIERYHIKTVLSLLPGGDERDGVEQEVVTAEGSHFVRVPIPFADETGEKFKTREDSLEAKLASVQQAISILTDPERQPVYVHCVGGMHRTGAVIALYRVRCCGWTEEQARDELATWGGFVGGTVWPNQLLQTFCSQMTHEPGQ